LWSAEKLSQAKIRKPIWIKLIKWRTKVSMASTRYTELTGEHDLLNIETNWKQQIAEKT
jgi:hypothetical protein